MGHGEAQSLATKHSSPQAAPSADGDKRITHSIITLQKADNRTFIVIYTVTKTAFWLDAIRQTNLAI